MVETWTKLMSSILDSSVWCYDNSTKIVWITLMAMADKNGIVHGAIPGIARRAGVTTKEAREAMEIFQKPDPDSRSQDHDGRRVERRGRDWFLLNHSAIRELGRHEAELARKRKWWAENRGKDAGLDEPSASTRPIQSQIPDSDPDPDPKSDPDPDPKAVKKKSTLLRKESKSGETWKAYSLAYEIRYGTAPKGNAGQYSMCCKLVDYLEADTAPLVAQYYLSINNAYYNGRAHPLSALVADHQKVHMEWKTGTQITQTESREQDRLSKDGREWKNVIDKMGE